MNKLKNLIVGGSIFLGLVYGSGFYYVSEFVNPNIKQVKSSKKELESYYNLLKSDDSLSIEEAIPKMDTHKEEYIKLKEDVEKAKKQTNRKSELDTLIYLDSLITGEISSIDNNISDYKKRLDIHKDIGYGLLRVDSVINYLESLKFKSWLFFYIKDK